MQRDRGSQSKNTQCDNRGGRGLNTSETEEFGHGYKICLQIKKFPMSLDQYTLLYSILIIAKQKRTFFQTKFYSPENYPTKVKEIFCYRVKEQGLMSPRFSPVTLCYLDSRLVAFLRQFLLQAPRILKLLLQQQNPLLGLNLLKIATRH